MIGLALLAAAAAPLITGDDGQIRCAAAFAVVGSEQQQGVAAAARFPAMAGAGQEFFVRAMAARMERDGLDRPAAATLARGAVERLQADRAAAADPAAFLGRVMEGCLPLLVLVPHAGE